METKIVKTLKFPNDSNDYQINAAKVANTLTVGNKKFDGSSPINITSSDLGLPEPLETWVLECKLD